MATYRIYFYKNNVFPGDYGLSLKSIKHPKYRINVGSDFDIGLIKLKDPVGQTYDSNNIICLPVRKFKITGTKLAAMAGAGPNFDKVRTGPVEVKEYKLRLRFANLPGTGTICKVY